jgi:hypothetical protein
LIWGWSDEKDGSFGERKGFGSVVARDWEFGR